MAEQKNTLALALFSGGLDSILAAKLVQEQGLNVRCLHFVSPFFGQPGKIPFWERAYALHIQAVDIAEAFTRLLVQRPVFGFGSVMNPCVDCKILMLREARRIMEETGACCVISGEVLGQRPMSQRRDTLNAILRDSGLKGKLLRPLSARLLDPTLAELAGLIDRERLLFISGRGRKAQMALAAQLGLKTIPTPAGGCRLAEQENARSYWPVLCHTPSPAAQDFQLANIGRQYWHIPEAENAPLRLIIGRAQSDNDAIMALAGKEDLLFKTRDFPGPVALGRYFAAPWPREALLAAAALTASYAGKAVRHAAATGELTAVRIHKGSLDAPGDVLEIAPAREGGFPWREFSWEEARAAIRAERSRPEKRSVQKAMPEE